MAIQKYTFPNNYAVLSENTGRWLGLQQVSLMDLLNQGLPTSVRYGQTLNIARLCRFNDL